MVLNLSIIGATRAEESKQDNSGGNTGTEITVSHLPDGIDVTYKIQEPSLLECEGAKGRQVAIDAFYGLMESGKPSICSRTDYLVVPNGYDCSVELIDSVCSEMQVDLASFWHDEYGMSVAKDSILPYDGFFPRQLIEGTDVSNCRSICLLPVKVTPVQYDYSTGTLRKYSSLRYRVRFTERGGDAIESLLQPTEDYISRIKAVVLNPEDIPSVEERKVQAVGIDISGKPNEGYLIISQKKFNKSINKIARMKRLEGYNVHIRTSDSWTPDIIRNTIRSVATKDPMLTYLLIIGDDDQVPSNHITEGKHTGSFDFFPSDYDYGLITSSAGAFPELHRGRICTSDPEVALGVVDKIYNYQFNPVMEPSFYKTGIHMGQFDLYYSNEEYIPETKDSQTFISRLEHIANYMASNLDVSVKRLYWARRENNPETWSNGKPIPDFLRRPNYNWDANCSQFFNAMNEGAYYVLHYAHGRVDRWEEPYVKRDHLAQMSNGDKLPFLMSMSCESGRFSNDSIGFSHAFLNSLNGGTIGVIAGSDKSWIRDASIFCQSLMNTISEDPKIELYTGDIYDNPTDLDPITDIKTLKLGKVLDVAEEWLMSIATINQMKQHRRCFNLFGDPALSLRTKTPKRFDYSIKSDMNQKTILTIGEVDSDYDVILVNYNDGTVKKLSNIKLVPFPDSDYVEVCINADNYVPVVYGVNNGNNIYINSTPESPLRKTGEKLFIGNLFNAQSECQIEFDNTDINMRVSEVVIYPSARFSEESSTIITVM